MGGPRVGWWSPVRPRSYRAPPRHVGAPVPFPNQTLIQFVAENLSDDELCSEATRRGWKVTRSTPQSIVVKSGQVSLREMTAYEFKAFIHKTYGVDLRLGEVKVQILTVLLKKYPKEVTKEFAVEYVYGNRFDGGPEDAYSCLKTLIAGMRKDLRETPFSIINIRGAGYRITVEGEEQAGIASPLEYSPQQA